MNDQNDAICTFATMSEKWQFCFGKYWMCLVLDLLRTLNVNASNSLFCWYDSFLLYVMLYTVYNVGDIAEISSAVLFLPPLQFHHESKRLLIVWIFYSLVISKACQLKKNCAISLHWTTLFPLLFFLSYLIPMCKNLLHKH